ncbi:MAG TPA: fumarylacetoacetate hydrolase family protein [Thermodesulfobacteriota bacterium]|nr:fumarylacetoacetate hydrolase family protein [Thermodesulfobacteriota bacterium]
MRFVRFDGGRLGILRGEAVVDATDLVGEDRSWPPTLVRRLVEGFGRLRPQLEARLARGPGIPLAAVRLEAPVVHPSKIVGAYANYLAHHREMGGTDARAAEPPEVFLKAPSSIIGPGEAIRLPPLPGREVHHEAELAVVIGTRARRVRAADALACVFGYTGLMDITVRGSGERSRRKSYDTFTPVGPCVVTADEIPDPHALDIALWVDGTLRQRGNTRDMVFDIARLIEYTTAVMTLEPGDLLATGTPEGVGPINGAREVRLEIGGIGRLAVRVEPSQAAPAGAAVG